MGFTHTLGIVVLLQAFYQNVYGQLPVFRDDYTYVEQTQSYYKFHTTRVSWQGAFDTCAAEGATLFYPANDCEADIVLVHWSRTTAHGWAYIGVSSLNKGVFETIDGHSIWDVYSNWRPGEPNNANGQEKCVVFLRDGTLNDVQCDKTFPFICKKKLNSSKGTAICDKVESSNQTSKFRKDYQYLENTNSFYKIHTVQSTWRDATDVCNKEGAILFYPNNKCEVNVVLEFWNRTQPFDKVFVGISSLSKGTFQTIDGHSVWDVYNGWQPGEPNNANGNEECVVLSRDGLYNDARCGLSLPFICKKTDSNKQNVPCDDSDEETQVNFRKDYKYLKDTQSVYKIHTIFQNWQDAKVKCENEGASLFFPENECEANVVLDFWNKTQPFGWVYIGVYNPTTEASVLNFDTVDGRPVWQVFNTWRRGEPNNINGEENCVVLQREGTLNDDRCDKKYAFICKKAISKGNAYCDDIEKSKKFRKDYKYIEDTQSFYKMHGSFKNWQDAKSTCENEGAFLFYPENTCEANIVLNFWSKQQPSRRIHVGISSPSRGNFETVTGIATWKVYSKWRPGEPNNEYDVENCVILHRDNFEYSDDKCGQKLPFICKKKINPSRSGFGCDVKTNDTSENGFRTDYTYVEDTQSFYKMHTIFDNYETAKKICEQEKATLFYPENKCEYDAVSEYWDKTHPLSVDTVFMGVKRNNDGIFESIDGRRQPNIYLNWSPNEPNNSNNGEFCVVAYRHLGFNDIDCNRKFAFTCKKKDDVDRDAFCDTPGTDNKAGGSVQTGYKFLNDTQSSYKFHKKARNWQDANRVCAKEDATLFYPTNKCEAKSVLEYWSRNERFTSVLIGISSPLEGIFKTIDDKSEWDVYNNWRPGEPNNANGDENCVELLRDGTLNDVQCSKNYLYICKKEQSPRTSTALCDIAKNDKKSEGEFRKDYTYLSDTQSFYKIHTIKHRWQDAKEICITEGAILFYPENSCEANAVLELWNQTQTFGTIYVGISSPSKGVFETVSGRAVWQVYNNWRPGEPNNAHGKEGCVAFTRDGTYNDVECSLNFPFICKKKVSSNFNVATCDKPETDGVKDLSFRKDYKYIKETKSFYKIHTILEPWQEAKDACIKEETSLFYPEDEIETNAIIEFWKQTQPFRWIYIGVYNPTKATSASINNFKTIDGRPVNEVYNKWRVGEPNNANGEENCVTLSIDGTLTDDRCSQNYAFVCKLKIDSIKETPVKSDTETGHNQNVTFRKDYTYLKETSSFYKMHSTFLSWSNAKQLCMKEGAALFYPENKCEANVVLNFWTQTQIFRRVFIGVYSPSKTIFETIDGTPIWLAYDNWRPGEPDNANDNQKCVILNRDGTLNDDNCDIKVPFICKKKIVTAEKSACSKEDLDRLSDEKLLIQKDYNYLESTKALYKIHTIQQNWFDARKRCLNEGAYLFYPENKCEMDKVIEFWAKTQPFTESFIGISSPFTGSFETVDGRPVWEVYNVWGPGEPNNSGNQEGCVVISRENAKYNDDNCNKTGNFICKKKTETQNGDGVCVTTETEKNQINLLKDYTYLEDARGLFKFHTLFRSWNDAKETCFKEQASLFYPADENEFKVVQEFWNSTQYKANDVYIGISSSSRGTFNTVNGSQLTNIYNKWAPGKPTIANTNNGCILLHRNGDLDEDYCTNAHPFICKKTLELLNRNIICNTEDLDYRYNAAQKKCYKFHLTPMSWSDAFSACKAENSYLAVINDQAEADFLVKITARAPKDKVSGSFLSGAVHLGFYKQKGYNWKTVTGQLLQESGYDKWGYKQPDGGDQEPCGSMFYNGQLNDIGCKQRCFFICEHEINN